MGLLFRWTSIAALLFLSIWSIDHGLRLSSETTESEFTQRKIPTIEQTRGLVNKHLQITNKRIEIEQEHLQVQNEFSAPKVGDRIALKNIPSTLIGSPMDPDRKEHAAAQDLKKKKQLNFQEPSPELTGALRDQDDNKRFQDQFREAYVQKFLENARRAGYEVTLSQDLVVIGVRKVRPPAAQAYEGNGSGAQ